MYKLIAIDIDGTLLNDRREITAEVREAIIAAKKRGVKIVLCSGRAVGGVTLFLQELKLDGDDDYIIALNGARILKAATQEVIDKRTLGLCDLKDLYALGRELNTYTIFFDDTSIYSLHKYIHKYTVQAAFLSQVQLYYCGIEEVTDDCDISQIIFVDHPERLKPVFASLPENIKNKYSIVRSTPYYIEFLHPEATKGNAVKILAEKLGIRREEVMCIGDGGNDLSMIQYAGCGVAMGNATDELKRHADYITLSNNEAGVAHAIRKFVLE